MPASTNVAGTPLPAKNNDLHRLMLACDLENGVFAIVLRQPRPVAADEAAAAEPREGHKRRRRHLPEE